MLVLSGFLWLYVVSTLWCFVATRYLLKHHKDLFPEMFNSKVLSLIISVFPVFNTYVGYETINLMIVDYRKYRRMLKEIDKLDPLAKKLGYKSMRELIKSENSKKDEKV